MTTLAASGRRGRFTTPASEAATSIPVPVGSVGTIHPSVVDMGARWNGYRWWRADTPMPEQYENPSIYASNDRVTWVEPAGVSNPIDPWPGQHVNNVAWFNSDTELVWDQESRRLVVFWRDIMPAHRYYAASSRDGSTWLHHGAVIETSVLAGGNGSMSLTLAQDDEGGWRGISFGGGGTAYTAPSILGPWQMSPTPLTGWLSGDPGLAYHGDMIRHLGYWMLVANVRYLGNMPAISEDGYAWTWGEALSGSGAYRPTMLPSLEPGHIDVWGSGNYRRFPESIWLDLLP